MNISHLVACGLMITLLSLRTGAKPLTPAQQKPLTPAQQKPLTPAQQKPLTPAQQKSLRSLLGEELSEFMASGEREQRLEKVRSRVRLLRDLRMDTRAKAMWARLLNDQPSARRHKSNTKKGSAARSGCFGHKMDRIGTISGMGC